MAKKKKKARVKRPRARKGAHDEPREDFEGTRAARVDEGRLNLALEALVPALFIVDGRGRFASLNRAAEVLLGCSREEALGKTIPEALGEGELAERLSVIVQRARSGGPPVEYEVAYAGESGSAFEVGFTATLVVPKGPAAGPEKEPHDVVILGRDLHAPTESLRLRAASRLPAEAQAELRRQLRHVEQQMARSERLAAIGQMAAGLVHEINNPLGALAGFAEILKMDLDPGHPARALLGELAGEIERIERLVENMLDLARSTMGEEAARFAPVELAGLAGSVLRVMGPQLKLDRVKTAREFELEEAWILGDKDRLRQVLMNIVLNAAQAMSPAAEVPPRGGRLTVRILPDEVQEDDLPPRRRRIEDLATEPPEALEEEADRARAGRQSPPWRPGGRLVRIEVEDTGPGVAEEIMGRIFDPFFTTKPAGEGTGLGLSTAEVIVRAHGGKIAAENVPGGGARFVIRLPRAEPEEG